MVTFGASKLDTITGKALQRANGEYAPTCVCCTKHSNPLTTRRPNLLMNHRNKL